MRFTQYRKGLRISNLIMFILSLIGGIIINQSAQAAFSDIDPSFTSSPYTCPANPNDAADPTNHKMYVVAVNPRPYTPKTTQDLIWSAGTESKTFTFDGNKNFTISFTELVDEVNGSSNPFFGAGTGPGPANGTYDSGDLNTADAINTIHGTAQGQNHVLNVSVNRNVSKIGYKIQDVDSRGIGVVRYRQRVDVSPDGGIFDNLSFNSALQDINNTNNVITAKRLRECSLGQCVIDASWSYTTATSLVRLRHTNFDRGVALPRDHIVGYSDFYFCHAPPKIIVNKTLDGTRIDDDDQFRIEVRQSSDNTEVAVFTTTGTGSTVNDNTTDIKTLRDGFDYTILERVIDGNLLDYNATYSCSNATTGSNVTFNSGTMTTNTEGTMRSFNINNVGYGDEITCTITNVANEYTFTGYVFNDNGGISSNDKFDISSTFKGNSGYFNGAFESSTESGIYHPDLKVSLNDCNGNIINATSSPNPQPIPSSGQYSFTVQPDKLPSNNKVCINEIEPDPWSDYPVDTTPNEYEFTLKSGVFDYKTGVQDATNNTLDLDFGEVMQDQSALVLRKYQYIHACDDTLDYAGSTINQPTTDPRTGFSENPPQTSVEPGNCIAYRIDAYNRGHVDLKDVQITDKLQNKTVTSIFVMPLPIGSSNAVYDNNSFLPAETIVSKKFNLDKSTGASATKATLYFNTKYGTTNGNNP